MTRWLPMPNAGLRLARALHDGVRAEPIGGCDHDLGAPHGLARTVAIRDDRLKVRPVRRADVPADVGAPHHCTLTDVQQYVNQLLGVEH